MAGGGTTGGRHLAEGRGQLGAAMFVRGNFSLWPQRRGRWGESTWIGPEGTMARLGVELSHSFLTQSHFTAQETLFFHRFVICALRPFRDRFALFEEASSHPFNPVISSLWTFKAHTEALLLLEAPILSPLVLWELIMICCYSSFSSCSYFCFIVTATAYKRHRRLLSEKQLPSSYHSVQFLSLFRVFWSGPGLGSYFTLL